MSGWTADRLGDQDGKVVVVTGGNSGVGLGTARALTKAGAHVVLACRDPGRAEQAREEVSAGVRGRATTVRLDLSDLESVAACADRLAAEHAHLDVLVCNAGVMGGPFSTTAQGYEMQMGTNHLGHFALAARLWPLVAAAPAGRVVVVSSVAARGGNLGPDLTKDDLVAPTPYRPGGVYANTKQANLLFAQELHRRARTAASPVRVVAAHPGVSTSNLFVRQTRALGLGWLAPVISRLMPLVFQSGDAGALPSLRAAFDPEVGSGAFVGPGGLRQTRGAPVVLDVYRTGADPRTAVRLWELSEELTGTTFPF